jgi:hypothetical protein
MVFAVFMAWLHHAPAPAYPLASLNLLNERRILQHLQKQYRLRSQTW